jgi:hypothetical protein
MGPIGYSLSLVRTFQPCPILVSMAGAYLSEAPKWTFSMGASSIECSMSTSSIRTFSVTTFSITTFSITTLSITTLSITTFT